MEEKMNELNELMERIIKESNDKKILYHGIRNTKNNRIDRIIEEGLKPTWGYEKPVSFWSTGKQLFYPEDDSPFFNYSGSFENPKLTQLNLVMTRHDLLSGLSGLKKLPQYEKDSQITIPETIPFELISLINIQVKHPHSNENQQLRAYRQCAEQMLLNSINKVLIEFTPGKMIKWFREVK
jgi:hypothetical protein